MIVPLTKVIVVASPRITAATSLVLPNPLERVARKSVCPACWSLGDTARGPQTAAQAGRSMIARARETLFGRREDDEPQEHPQAAE
jgi:hypothetical protein